jgi:hypothetical protein
LPVDPQLPGPGPARDGVEARVRQVALEPAIETDAVVVGGDSELANVAHGGDVAGEGRRRQPFVTPRHPGESRDLVETRRDLLSCGPGFRRDDGRLRPNARYWRSGRLPTPFGWA